MDNTNDTTPPTPHTTLQDAADLLCSYGWTAGQVTAITAHTDIDWIESRERAYKLADANDARAARLAAIEAARMAAHQRPQPTGTATRMPKVKAKKVAPGTGTSTMFDV
jgi:hypothetical protein